MEPQPLRPRRSGPLPCKISCPDSMNASQQRVIADPSTFKGLERVTLGSSPLSSMENAFPGPEDQSTQLGSSQARKLQLRQARFKGLTMPPRKVTPTGGMIPAQSVFDFASMDTLDSSPFENDSLPGERRLSNDLGILQEVSNSSLRRKKSRREGLESLFEPAMLGIAKEENARLMSHPPADGMFAPAITCNSHLTVMANSSMPLRAESSKTPWSIARTPRSGTAWRSTSGGESSEYIEHLESQLAALQTQLQALSSPSISRTQSVKMRALNSEASQLRQEVADWERKFHERIDEQLEQHDMVVGSLKAQIRSMQKELETETERIKELAIECEEKTKQVMAAEGANYDLERRLEFMSELLAASPAKILLHSEAPLEARRMTGPRPFSWGSAKDGVTFKARQISPRRRSQDRNLHRRLPTLSPESPTRRTYSHEENPFDRMAAAHQSGTDSATEAESAAMSDGTLIGSTSISPGRRSLTNYITSDSETKVRPTRRMRRFYTGSMGPRSLILPTTTTHAEPYSVTTPLGTTTPTLPPMTTATPSHGHGLGFILPISPERPQLHKRSATWDEHEASIRRPRRHAPTLTPLRLPTPPSRSEKASPIASFESSSQSAANRVVSLGSVQARNLFEELSRIKNETANDRKSTDSTQSLVLIHGGVPDSTLESDAANEESNVEAGLAEPPIPSSLLQSPPPDEPPSWIPAIDSQRIPITTILQYLPKPPSEASQMHTESPQISPPDSPLLWIPAKDECPISPCPTQAGLITTLLSTIGKKLDTSAPSVRQVFSNAWSVITLSRPVLEFRWWLVRLLIGGLREKHRLKLLAAARSSGRVGISTAPGLVTSGVGFDGRGSLRQRNSLPRRPVELLGIDADGSDADDDLDDDGEVVRRDRPKLQPVAAPVAWLKLGMTLVFAVGVAIKDGPASLFKMRPPDCGCACGGRRRE